MLIVNRTALLTQATVNVTFLNHLWMSHVPDIDRQLIGDRTN